MNNIPFARFLKQTLKNCQRIRAERQKTEPVSLLKIYRIDSSLVLREEVANRNNERHVYWLETEAMIRRYLYDRMSPYGIVGAEHDIRYFIKYAKIVKRLGKAARKQGKLMFLKTAFIEHFGATNNFDWRIIPFSSFNFDEYEVKKMDLKNLLKWKDDPF